MPRYHVNPETGRPNICRARTPERCQFAVKGKPLPPHFDTKAEAREYAENTLKDKHGNGLDGVSRGNRALASKNPKKPLGITGWRSGDRKKDLFVSHLQSVFFDSQVGFAHDLDVDFYHVHNADMPEHVGSINDDMSGKYSNKPQGALWLASGNEGHNGKVVTSWTRFNSFEQFKKYDSSTRMSRIRLKEDAVILELGTSDLNIVVSEWARNKDIIDPFADRSKTNITHLYPRMMEAGVDDIRVNGEYDRDAFYGWDCDTLCILNGDSIEGFDEVTMELDDDVIMADEWIPPSELFRRRSRGQSL